MSSRTRWLGLSIRCPSLARRPRPAVAEELLHVPLAAPLAASEGRAFAAPTATREPLAVRSPGGRRVGEPADAQRRPQRAAHHGPRRAANAVDRRRSARFAAPGGVVHGLF